MPFSYGRIYGNFGDEKVVSADPIGGNPLGTALQLPDGRVFYHAFSQGAIGAGQLCMASAGIAAQDMDLVIPTAVAAAAKTLTVTLGAGTITANQFSYLYVNDGGGEGHLYRIASHPAGASSANVVFTLEDGDAIAEALTTASLVGLMEDPYKDIEVYDADDIDGFPVGVAPTEVADNRYHWTQTWGYANVLASATVPVLGKAVVPDPGTDGAVSTAALTEAAPNTGFDQPIVGVWGLIAVVDTDYGICDLKIRP